MPRSQRVFQITSVVLLLVCFAQAAYWIVEEVLFTQQVRERVAELYQADAESAGALIDAGHDPAAIEARSPHLVVTPEGVDVRPEALAALADERRRRLNRYGWEGSFFLLVLLVGMGVILQALRANNALLRRQQNFLASVSHELKSPLASVKLSAETMLLRRPDQAAVAKLADRMVQDADRLTTLVSNLLDVARLEEGQVSVSPRPQALAPLVDHTLQEMESELVGIAVEVDVQGDPHIHADSAAFATCLRNLLGNAAKAVRAPEAVEARIQVRAAAGEGGSIAIHVIDRGAGFDPAEARRIFDKFYRPGDELRRRSKGSGLGLYLVRQLAGLHGASVHAASEGTGTGATFTLRWPSAGRPR